MKRLLLCLFALALAARGAVTTPDEKKVTVIRESFRVELAIMARYRADPIKGYDDVRVMPAAERFFADAPLVGLPKAAVESLIGTATTQMYGNGETFIIREILYDESGLVSGIKKLKSR